MQFTKMHGCGNDYVYIDGGIFKMDPDDKPGFVRFVSDRHFGIGSDGLILICGSEKCDIRMRVFNPDGTEAEMCGNALRSAAALVRMKGIICKDDITVETLGGEKSVRILSLDGGYCIAKSDLGVPEGFKAFEEPVSVRGRKFEISVLSLGNPHIAAFTSGIDRLNIKKYGPPLEKSGYFPNGANVHFYSVSPGGEIAARSWERGCGETLSCATGAAAAFAAARARGSCGGRAYVRHPGGTLLAESGDGGRIFVTGETRLVFEGELLPEDTV